jgi:hypothetical protein
MVVVVSHHDLEALPVGEEMEVHDLNNQYAVWTRVVGGWQMGAAVLDSAMFEGLAKANRVGVPRLRVTAEVGQWWGSPTYVYFIYRIVNGQAEYFRFRRNDLAAWRHFTGGRLDAFDGRERVVMGEPPVIPTHTWMAIVAWLVEEQRQSTVQFEHQLKNSIQRNDLQPLLTQARQMVEQVAQMMS